MSTDPRTRSWQPQPTPPATSGRHRRPEPPATLLDAIRDTAIAAGHLIGVLAGIAIRRLPARWRNTVLRPAEALIARHDPDLAATLHDHRRRIAETRAALKAQRR